MNERPEGDEPDFEILEIIGVNDNTGPQHAARSAAHATGPVAVATPVATAQAARAAHASILERRQAREEGARLVLRDLLPPLDALESCVREDPDPVQLEQAVRMALRALWNVFRPHELERIEGHGMPFDPRLHEAAEITPSSRVPANTVLETLRVGYLLGGELVRPALVRVSVDEPRASRDGGHGA